MNFNSFKKSNVFWPKTIVGVSLFGHYDQKFRAEIVILKRHNNQIESKHQQVVTGALGDIFKHLPPKSIVCLTLDGKGLIFREWVDEESSKNQLLNDILPQSNMEDFYLQKHKLGQIISIAIARRNYVDGIISSFNLAGFTLIDVVFGPFILNNTAPLVAEAPSKWRLPNRTLIWENETICEFPLAKTHEKEFYCFGQESVSSEYVIAFSHAFWVLVSPHNLHDDIAKVVAQRSNQYYKKAIERVGIGVLAFYLLLLLINYVLFSHYSIQMNETYTAYNNGLQTINRLEALTSDLQQQELLAKKTGMGNRVQLSYYADRLASTLPSDMSLYQMKINPVKNQRNRNETPEFSQGEIYISGNISNGNGLYLWIEKLKKLLWIQHVEVINLNQEGPSKPANFSVEIKYSL